MTALLIIKSPTLMAMLLKKIKNPYIPKKIATRYFLKLTCIKIEHFSNRMENFITAGFFLGGWKILKDMYIKRLTWRHPTPP